MAKILRFSRDERTARAGRWVRYRDDIDLRIASTALTDWQNAYRDAVRIEREASRGEPNLDDAFLARQARIIATHLLKDWRNVEAEDGSPLAYTVDEATRLLADPGMTDLRVFVLRTANEDEAFQRRNTEAALGN